jgi:DNA-binding CsgD family transcriptional regulator
MRTWALDDHSLQQRRPAGADEVLAGLIDAIGEADFGRRLLVQLNRLLPVGSVSAYRLARGEKPQLIATATQVTPDRTAEVWRAYSGDVHRLDRTFDASWNSPGHLLTHLRKDHFTAPHQRLVCDPLHTQERLSLAVACDGGRLLAVNLYRCVGQPWFSAEEAEAVGSLARPLVACVRQQAKAVLAPPAGALPDVRALRLRLAGLCPRLTPRELDVVSQLAVGRSYEDVGVATGLSLSTVKTYRERSFLKLGLTSRAQLWALLAPH